MSNRTKTDEYKLQHSTFFEETFAAPELGVAFLKQILPKKLLKQIDVGKLTVEKAKFRDTLFRETRPDIVYRVPILGAKEQVCFHTIIEHKSFDDHSAIYQIWQYVTRLCIQDVEKRLVDPETKKHKKWPKNFRLSPIIPILLHQGGKAFTGETQLARLFSPLAGAEDFLPHMQAILIDLSAMKDEQLPRDPATPELHVVLTIMKTIFSKSASELKRKFYAILDELRPYLQNRKYGELIRKLWYYATYNAENLTEADAEEIETRIRETIGDKDMPTLAQIYIDKGIEIGIAQGETKGKAEGKAESIHLTLTKRFKTVPQTLEEQILALTDLERLEKLADFAYDCQSLEDFAKAME